MENQVGWGHPGQPQVVPASGPSPWHAVGPCTASALQQQQQLGRTIVQTQEGSDSRVSRAGRNQRRRHLRVSHNAADGGSETRAGEDRPSSPQDSSRKGRAKPHGTRRLHFLELFALKGGSSVLHTRFSPALPALQRGAGLLHNHLQHPWLGMGQGMGCLHPELSRSKLQGWVMDELVCCPSVRATGTRILHLPQATPNTCRGWLSAAP